MRKRRLDHSAPVRIFVDNGSEFSGRLLDLWAHHHQVQIDLSRPGNYLQVTTPLQMMADAEHQALESLL